MPPDDPYPPDDGYGYDATGQGSPGADEGYAPDTGYDDAQGYDDDPGYGYDGGYVDDDPYRYAADDAYRRAMRRRGSSALGVIALGVFGLMLAAGAAAAVFGITTFTSLTNGLKDPTDLERFVLQEQSVITDRTGKIQLATFGEFQRDVVDFEDIPPVMLDATTAIEDHTFWENPGFDPLAIGSAALDALRGRARGASTITQQLVRQRLLDVDLVRDPGKTPQRKILEIIQSIRVTQAYQGEEGKQQIIAAYLNQNYYGNDAYGIKAAARAYFGTSLDKLTLAQAAILAAIPQAPSTYDLVRNAEETCTVDLTGDEACPSDKVKLVVPDDAPIVQRRNQVLELMSQGRTPRSGPNAISDAEFAAAKREAVVLNPPARRNWIAPHFIWQVREELTRRLCGEEAETCPEIEEGGLLVRSTLDRRLQIMGERWVKAAAIVPKAKQPDVEAGRIRLKYERWMQNLAGKKLFNGALIAMDYQTGQIIAYVGSADYYGKPSKGMQPQFDVLADGYRQPGSAFKPIMYSIGIEDKTLSAGTMFMDVATDFGNGYIPLDADRRERGPLRLRDALRFSLNIPAVKAASVIGPERVFGRAQAFGLDFATDQLDGGLSVALGVEEVHPKDMVRAYGTIANGGVLVPQITILDVKDTDGKVILEEVTQPKGQAVISPQTAYVMTDILAGNTDPNQNPFWGKFELQRDGRHRPATLKTGTNNDAKDLNAYGFIAPPTAEGRSKEQPEYALVVGAWNGNSDNSDVSTSQAPLVSLEVSTYVWEGFLRQATTNWEINDFARPDGITEREIDPWTGVQPLPGGRKVKELFIDGGPTPPALPAENGCGENVLRVAGFEDDHPEWLQADRNWIKRAQRGPGTVGGPRRTATTYFYDGRFVPYGRSWGPVLGGAGCASPSPSVTVDPCASPIGSVDPSVSVDPSASAVICPSPSASESVSPSPSESIVPTPPPPTDTPTAPPTPTPTPEPTPTPTPAPTPTPTPTPTDTPAP
jgi:membrane peptidoglycan carboxypeptidase